MPDIPERHALQVTALMLGVLVKTAGYYETVPGDDSSMPETPAMVIQTVFEAVAAVLLLTIAAVPLIHRDQPVGIILIIVDLCGLKPHLVHTDVFGEVADLIQLVFVRPDDEELKKYKRGLA